MKTMNHDYLIKVQNNDEGWALIKEMRKQTKACNSKYKIVLRGSRPLTPWGNRASITLDQAQDIRLYIRLKD